VTAHYIGKLTDGTEFDASRKRGRPFQFPIGMSRVIKAWDVGIATMCKGELSVFLISSSYGYGAAGAGGVIPVRILAREEGSP
jgi:FKBP-type peptidyl-prolyl cis-trans isomerase